MHKALALGALAALGLTTQAFAEDGFSYSFLEGNYVSTNIDGVNGHPDGFGVNGSIGFTPMLHGYVDYTNIDTHGTTVQGWEVGLGANHSIAPNIDLIGSAGYLRSDVEHFGNDNGFALQAGVRGRAAENFELEGLVHYTDLGGHDGDTTAVRANARYFFMPQFAVGAGLEYDKDATVWNVGVRWDFK